jgi:hypothetical protein
MRRIIGLTLIVLLTLLAPLAEQVRDGLWQSYQAYITPFAGPLPAGALRPPLAPRVVLLLVHGLRLDASNQMPSLNALRGRGADIIIESPPPTFRLPATFGWISGATPDAHGVTTNDSPRMALPDNLFESLQAASRPVAIVGSSSLYALLEGTAQRVEITDEDDPALSDQQAVNRALQVLRDPQQQPAFMLIEFNLLEDVARKDPPAYPSAAAATDVRIQSIVDVLDLSNSAVVVLSDRGLNAAGHDGGDEPEIARAPMVLAGAGVLPDVQAIAPQSSIAPTLAELAGTPIPLHAEGAPIFAALQADATLPMASARQLTAFYEQWSEVVQQPRFAAPLLTQYEAQLQAGDMSAYTRWQAALQTNVQQATAARLSDERWSRLPFVSGMAVMLIALSALMLGSRPALPLLGLGLYGVIAMLGFFALRGFSLSLTLFVDGRPAEFLAAYEKSAALWMALAAGIVALLTVQHDDVLDAIASVMVTLGLIALANVAVFVWFYWQWGDAFVWKLPAASQLVAVMLALTHLGAFSLPLSPALPDIPIALPLVVFTAIVFALTGGMRVKQRGDFTSEYR